MRLSFEKKIIMVMFNTPLRRKTVGGWPAASHLLHLGKNVNLDIVSKYS